MPDWEALREAGRAIKERDAPPPRHTTSSQLEESVTRAGGNVHWARDAAEANRIITGIVAGHGAKEVVKIKSLTTDEIGLNEALARASASTADRDRPGRADHPARRRAVVAHPRARRSTRTAPRSASCSAARSRTTEGLTDEPRDARRRRPRRTCGKKFLSVPVAVSGANFGVAETGTICIVESEGNGRMCLTLPAAC